MNRLTKWMIAVCIILTVCLCGTLYVFALSDKESEEPNVMPVSSSDNTKNEVPVKDETVYVFTSSDGSVKNIIVSDWIKNSLYQNSLNDVSDLENIENVKGYEEYSDGKWDANGNDIYYQGVIKKNLPVNFKISYFLDDVACSGKDLVGKSGKVKIRFDFEDCQYDEDQDIYVPFVVLTATALDNDVFRNVECKNAKLINDGDLSFIVGYAFVGINENLKLDKEESMIPSYFEITSDVENFKMNMTLSVATNSIFNSLDLSSEEDLDLVLTVNQLLDGVGQLYDGTNQLYDGSLLLADGISQVSNGLNQLSENSSLLNGGARQIFEGLLDQANTQLQAQIGLKINILTMDNYSEEIDKTIDYLNNFGITLIAKKKAKDGVKQLEELKTQLDGINMFYTGLCQYTDGVDQVTDGVNLINANMSDFTSGIAQLNDGVRQLFEGISIIDPSSIDALKQTIELSKSYKNFSGLSSEMEGNVKFIFRTDELK